jgi:hypothetical protein
VIKARFGDRLDAWVEAALPFLFRRAINPNAITVAGTAVSFAAGVAFAMGVSAGAPSGSWSAASSISSTA